MRTLKRRMDRIEDTASWHARAELFIRVVYQLFISAELFISIIVTILTAVIIVIMINSKNFFFFVFIDNHITVTVTITTTTTIIKTTTTSSSSPPSPRRPHLWQHAAEQLEDGASLCEAGRRRHPQREGLEPLNRRDHRPVRDNSNDVGSIDVILDLFGNESFSLARALATERTLRA